MARQENDLDHYRFVLRPWLWLLSQRVGLSHLQEQDGDRHHQGDLREGRQGRASTIAPARRCQPIDYCVQYRETDLDFVLRLMEQYGVYYYFKHSDGDHKLVLATARVRMTRSAPRPSRPSPGGTAYPFMPKDRSQRRHVEHLTQWSAQRRLRTGKVELKDYDFEKSTSDLTARAEQGFPAHQILRGLRLSGCLSRPRQGREARPHQVQAEQAQDERRLAIGEAPSLNPGTLMTFGGPRRSGRRTRNISWCARHMPMACRATARRGARTRRSTMVHTSCRRPTSASAPRW